MKGIRDGPDGGTVINPTEIVKWGWCRSPGGTWSRTEVDWWFHSPGVGGIGCDPYFGRMPIDI